jgi:multidrug resistance efflux pump
MKLPASWPRIRPAPPDPKLDQILAAVRTNGILLATINAKLEKLMATVADVQAALASSESKEATIIGLLTTEAQLQKDTLAQLQALQASGSTDPAALQTIVDKMTADNANMDAAIASVQPPAPAAA